jgi:hypothetical protein
MCVHRWTESVQNSDSTVLIVFKRESVTEVPINPIIRSRTRYFRHTYPQTRDNIVLHLIRAEKIKHGCPLVKYLYTSINDERRRALMEVATVIYGVLLKYLRTFDN